MKNYLTTKIMFAVYLSQKWLKKTYLITKKVSHRERWLREKKKQNVTLSQEEPEQIGSFKNSRWEIPKCSSRKLPVNGIAKVPAKRSGLIPRFGRASLGNSLVGGDGLFTMKNYSCMMVFLQRWQQLDITGELKMQIKSTACKQSKNQGWKPKNIWPL